NYPLNHIYALDVVRIIQELIERGVGIGKAYNIAQDEHLSLEDFLALLAEIMDVSTPDIVRFPRKELEAQGLMPDCSPFSERWMSALDNSRSKAELGISYTPLAEYLTEIVTEFEENPPPEPSSYRRRKAELQLVRMAN
ncbi:MAG: epimerase, partial [Chloroflexi bacterium]